MPKKIVWSPSAKKDFSKILNYLFTDWNNEVVNQYMDKIENLLNQISLNPKQFPLISKDRNVRKGVISKHNTLYYRISKSKIDLLRIFDTRQNPNKLEL